MPNLPARCTNPACKHIFPSGVHVAHTVNSRIRIRAHCPLCGSLAIGIEGRFNFPGLDTIEVISATPDTIDLLQELQRIAEKARSGQITEAEALQQTSSVAPAFGRYLHFLASIGVPVLAVLIPLVALYLQFAESQSSDKFQDEALKMMRKQTELMELLQHREDIHYYERIYDERTAPTNEETPPHSVIPEPRPDRRATVRAERRAEVKKKRLNFGGARAHKLKSKPSKP